MPFCPDDAPPRLIRYADSMPLPNILSLFFKSTNLLIIDKVHYARLDWIAQHELLRTEQPCMEIYYPPNRPPLVTPRSKNE